jgi:hypothetical protein
MHPHRALPVYTTVLAWFVAAASVAAAILLPLFDKSTELLLSVILIPAGVLVAAGWFAFRKTSAWLSVALVTVGALACGVGLVWTLFMPIAAIALIVLFALSAFRGSSGATTPGSV